MPKEGEKLPAVSFRDETGRAVAVKDLKLPAALYFYPKDDTAGCTKEACGIRDAWSDFQAAGLHVYGVSLDDAESHRKFREKYGLPHTLLTADQGTLETLGIWKEKNMYGKKYWGIARETFLLDDKGKVLKHYARVKPEEHADALLADFRLMTV
jgi:thioredoxin-dependent peroxiredoxin